MSCEGRYTPLELNTNASVQLDSGFRTNPAATTYQGTWSPSSYTPGSLISGTFLQQLTSKIPLVYAAIVGGTTFITPTTYRNLIQIGSGVCPALGNSRPPTFKPSYAGWGSWVGSSLEIYSYPPRGVFDSASGKWLESGTSYSWIDNTYGSYGWITGWPGQNSWQKTTDTYYCAVEPPPGSTINTTNYDDYFKDGFLATVARQAYYELWAGKLNRYPQTVSSFIQTSTYKERKNSYLASYINSKSFMSGTYSNINDLTSSDISGVTQAFKIWGNDLIASGRSINLSSIDVFGLPSALLKNLQLPQNNALTDAVKLALMLPVGLGGGNFTTVELQSVLQSGSTPTPEQEQRIYKAFKLIRGEDLFTVKYALNCATPNIGTLADLLDPKMLFPNSYPSLTIPQYNTDRTVSVSSKIYYFIYDSGGVNQTLYNWGESYLGGILPSDLVVACGAFAMTMQQITNIKSMNIERFSQVVSNLELVTMNNTLINTGNGVAVDVGLADSMIKNYGLGSGNSGSYRQCDFYGAASGYPYTELYDSLKYYLDQLPTATLAGIYAQIYNAVLSTNVDPLLPPLGITNAQFQTLIDNANAEIVTLNTNYPDVCAKINYYWNAIGHQLYIEQRAIPQAIPNASDIVEGTATSTDAEQFTQQLRTYAGRGGPGQEAQTLEAISDTTTVGGQSLVGALREARNGIRLGLSGGVLDNTVSDLIDTCTASGVVSVVNGRIVSVTVTSGGSGYDAANPPSITVYPVNVQTPAKLVAEIARDGSISTIVVQDGGLGYTGSTTVIEIDPPPQCDYPNPPQQTYSDTPWGRLVPPPLVAPNSASPSVEGAIQDVTQCNCDCWTV